MPPSRLDGLYRRLLMTKFFEKGWGQPENLQRYINVIKMTNKSSRIKVKIVKRFKSYVHFLFSWRMISVIVMIT